MEVSWNGDAPKSSMFKRYSIIINHTVFLGYLHAWKHPYHIFPSWIGSPVLNGAGKRSDTSKEVRLGSFWLGENRGFLGPQTEKDPMAELISGFFLLQHSLMYLKHPKPGLLSICRSISHLQSTGMQVSKGSLMFIVLRLFAHFFKLFFFFLPRQCGSNMLFL